MDHHGDGSSEKIKTEFLDREIRGTIVNYSSTQGGGVIHHRQIHYIISQRHGPSLR